MFPLCRLHSVNLGLVRDGSDLNEGRMGVDLGFLSAGRASRLGQQASQRYRHGGYDRSRSLHEENSIIRI